MNKSPAKKSPAAPTASQRRTTRPPLATPDVAEGAWRNALPGREQVAELKRQAIIREAARAFSRKGFHGTSMDDIAAHLGVTKAALYRYVQTKHEILFASFMIGLDSGFANMDRAEKEGSNGLEKLRIALTGYLEDMLGSLGHPTALLEENALLPEHAEIVIERRDEAEKRFRAMVKAGISDGSIIPCNPKLAIFAVLGAVNWVPKWYRDDGEWKPDEAARSLVDLVTRGLATHSSDDIESQNTHSARAEKVN